MTRRRWFADATLGFIALAAALFFLLAPGAAPAHACSYPGAPDCDMGGGMDPQPSPPPPPPQHSNPCQGYSTCTCVNNVCRGSNGTPPPPPPAPQPAGNFQPPPSRPKTAPPPPPPPAGSFMPNQPAAATPAYTPMAALTATPPKVGIAGGVSAVGSNLIGNASKPHPANRGVQAAGVALGVAGLAFGAAGLGRAAQRTGALTTAATDPPGGYTPPDNYHAAWVAIQQGGPLPVGKDGDLGLGQFEPGTK